MLSLKLHMQAEESLRPQIKTPETPAKPPTQSTDRTCKPKEEARESMHICVMTWENLLDFTDAIEWMLLQPQIRLMSKVLFV